MEKGQAIVFTGEGKGKTSAALGIVTRALLIGKRVVWVAFYKGAEWQLAEKGLGEKFEKLEMHFTGKGFHIEDSKEQKAKSGVGYVKIAGEQIVVDKANEEEHKTAAKEGLRLAKEKLRELPFLLVLDEVLNAVSEGLIEEEEVRRVIEERGEVHVVLTGRGLTEELKKIADLVTECKKIKHPYDKGRLAVRGIDF